MENTINIFKNGSTWLRADFHLHTKADKEFKFSDEENDFARQYIEQLKKQEISIGVITDHNKFDLEEFTELYKEAEKNEIYLLPGIEFSCKDGRNGIHLLIVFEHSWIKNENCIEKFIVQAFGSITGYDKHPYPNSNFNLDDTVNCLNNYGKDYFIIAAHVDDDNGLFQELKGRNLKRWLQSEAFNSVLGLQKAWYHDNVTNLENILQRQRIIALVEGTDSACLGIDGIGTSNKKNGITQKTFIKLGAFNFDSLKFALLNSENRVAKEKPSIKNSYIKSIAFEGGLLDGKEIHFSPELNSIIGIRGSGKSSIIEILRHSLNIPLGTKPVDSKYKNGLIEHVLKSGGKVIIQIINEHNEDYRVEKIYGQKEDIYDLTGIRQDVSIEAIFKKPIYFGQKDLSNKDVDFESDLIKKLIGSHLDAIRNKIERKQYEISNHISEISKLRNLKELKVDTDQRIKNAEYQLKLYREKGVEKKLNQQTLFDSDVTKLTEIDRIIQEYLSDLNSIAENYSDFFKQDFPASNINVDIFIEAENIFNQLKAEFEKVKRMQIQSYAYASNFNHVLKKLVGKKENLKEEFAKIKREINIPNLNPDEFLKLNRQVQTSRLKLKEIEKSEMKRGELKSKLKDELSELNNLWHEEFKILKIEIERINQSENKLKIEVLYKGRKDNFKDEMKQLFRGTNIRETAYDQIVEKYADFVEIFKNTEPLREMLNENQFHDFRKLFDEHQAELLTFKVDNRIVINYHGKPLKDHSLGQRASALILFLLAQKENDVLIIDQPEDDLDNQTIYEEVIKQIKLLKGNMQFIFATHNANIPVLGDSEKLIACTNVDNKEIMLLTGTIDNHPIQERIVNIMEGGKEAFRLRKDIYNIWKIEK